MASNSNSYLNSDSYKRIARYCDELRNKGYTLKEMIEAVMKYGPYSDMKKLTEYVNERI